jgi:hypothetical protein
MTGNLIQLIDHRFFSYVSNLFQACDTRQKYFERLQAIAEQRFSSRFCWAGQTSAALARRAEQHFGKKVLTT